MSLYGWIILGTICGPFFLSFDKKVHFYTYWKSLFPALFLVGSIFLVWDSYFTQLGVWGFNPRYLTGMYLGNLPWEEVTFFLVVPYACIFIYEVLNAYFPALPTRRLGHLFAFAFTLAGLLFGSFHLDNLYTSSACLASALLTIGLYFVNRVEWYGRFVFAFLVCMLPFLVVNGILTGSLTDEPIVWYNENHIMGPRIVTIPLEDLFYNYAMLLPIAALFEFLKRKKSLS